MIVRLRHQQILHETFPNYRHTINNVPNISTQSFIISILDVLNDFIHTRLTVKSRDGMFFLDNEQTSKPYRKIGMHTFLTYQLQKYLFWCNMTNFCKYSVYCMLSTALAQVWGLYAYTVHVSYFSRRR